MPNWTRLRPALALALLGLLTIAPATPAAAKPLEQHCNSDITTGKVACYPSFAAEIDALSGGRVADVTDAHTLTQAQVGRIAAASPFILGVLYADINYGGGTWTFTSTAGCGTNHFRYFGSAELRGTFIDNQTTSFKGFSNCSLKMFEDDTLLIVQYPNLDPSGSCMVSACMGPIGSTSALTALNDQVSYVEIYGL
ncbi:MAG: hypothetical protein JWQ81_2156 [Amycolatopsis sp.]|jgi:hypothetical protein|uniref:hypothetical protein n=1 Tax=Amycolatopsis sp. TaxID=37632 RepID=UPI00262C7780|nr:hypothetical protein [Amycolatopsis sp.]MCU1681417.1 hypothetical protein [Amycolatopsis sp.]